MIISAATGIGSLARCGVEAWPPRPVTMIEMTSADAIKGPPFVHNEPDGRFGAMCKAKAPSTFGSSSNPSSIMCLAPPKPSSPGWNAKRMVPRSASRCDTKTRAAPTSIATCASCPHACIAPSIVLAKSRPVSSGIGSASMSARNKIVGPSPPPPRRSATTEVTLRPVVTSSPSPSSAVRIAAWVRGSSSPSSGSRWIWRRSATTSSRTARDASIRLVIRAETRTTSSRTLSARLGPEAADRRSAAAQSQSRRGQRRG